jgi:rod shape determining protein RodA
VLASEYWYRFPWLLLAAALLLTGLGIAGIYAATAGGAVPAPFLDTLGAKQVIWLLAALGVFAATLVPSYTRLARVSYFLYGASIIVLAVLAFMRRYNLEIPGFIYPINNSYAWIRIPGTGVNIQPSELTKIAFIMSLAYYLRYRKNFRTFSGLMTPFLMALVPTALIFLAADLGTAMLFLPILFLMLFAAGARGKHLATIILIGMAMVPIFYSSMRGYQRLRIDSWLLQGCAERMHFALSEPRERDCGLQIANCELKSRQDEVSSNSQSAIRNPQFSLTPERKAELVHEITGMWRFRLWQLATKISWGKDKPEYVEAKMRLFQTLDQGPGPKSFDALRFFFGTLLDNFGYQAFQSKIALGAGGIAGQGWLQGTQTKYGLLPEAHTDFLFPTLAEQFGFLGAAGIVLLYGILCVLGVDVSLSTTEPYGKLLVVGVVALVAAQSFLNMAMSMGLMPVTGIPLPLMSYGGSSLLSSYLALGLLCNVAVRRLYLIAPRPFEWRE